MKLNLEDSQNLTHFVSKSLSNKNCLYFVFLHFSDKTGPACWLSLFREFLPTAMSLLNIHKPCKRSFLFLSTVQCPVAGLPSPDSWCIGRGGFPSKNSFISTLFSPGLQLVCALVSTWIEAFLSSLVIVCLHVSARGLESYLEHLLWLFLVWNLAWGQRQWLECMVPIIPAFSHRFSRMVHITCPSALTSGY